MSNMKLYASQGNNRAFKGLIAAQYNGVEIEIPSFEMGKDNKTPEFLKKNPLGKVPVLETPEGCIFESNAIARYIARIRNDTGIYGKTFFESGQIDSWVDFAAHELDVPVGIWLYPALNFMPFNAAATKKAKEDVHKALQILENHLTLRTYLVGEQITLADIVVVSSLVYPFKMILDKEFRKPYTCVTRWFQTCVAQPEFAAVVGDVPLCDKMITADGDDSAPKPAAKKAEPKKKEEKADAPAPEAPKKKAEHPLAVLNQQKPSSMVLDAWKVHYSNTKPLSKAMDWFWENLDVEGYTLWKCDYKYNEENTQMFMTSNAVSGFIQRSEAMRKFSFGVMNIFESGKSIEIAGVWLFRGDTEAHMLEANPDAEYYEWKKLEINDATKKIVNDFWVNEDSIDGKTIADSKVFK